MIETSKAKVMSVTDRYKDANNIIWDFSLHLEINTASIMAICSLTSLFCFFKQLHNVELFFQDTCQPPKGNSGLITLNHSLWSKIKDVLIVCYPCGRSDSDSK